jgi:type I restriction enzyme M protein
MTRITQQNLESYLWGAAVLLRGTIDAGDYKQFIFPLLFFKRLCDVFDEETANALRDSGGDQDFALFPENHRFQVPADAHWREIRKVNRDVGQGLQQAMRAIETANPDKLFGIFGDAQWTNKERLSDAMLRDLIEHFSTLELTVANLPEDELGQGYEYLIKKFADDSGHTAAEFYTNRTVVHLMTEMLDVQPGESVYDPTCGSGGMLLSCITHLRNQKKEWRNVKLYGQERNLMTSSIARMNCFLHGIEDFRIERGDTLAEPKLVEGDRLQRFDVVLANPPYSIKQWNREAFAADPWGRNIFGVPPQGRADYAFQQHILQSLKPKTGRCAVLWPHGVLFRKEEADMRRKLIEADLIECVIGLGPNLFYNSAMDSCVVICRTNKGKNRRGKILLIDAKDEVTRERTQSFLSPEHIARIIQTYLGFKEEPLFSRVVSKAEVGENDGNLNIALYIDSTPKNGGTDRTNHSDLEAAFRNYSESAASVHEALAKILPRIERKTIKGEVALHKICLPKWIDKSKWKRVRLGDVAIRDAGKIEPDGTIVYRWVAADHIDEGDIHVHRWSDTNDPLFPPTFRFTFKAGNVLLHSRNPKKVVIPRFDGITGEKLFVLKARDSEALSEDFLAFILMSSGFSDWVSKWMSGSVNKFLNWSAFEKFEFDLPPLDQQRRIAEILWAVDEVIGSEERTLASIEEALDAVKNAESVSGSPNKTIGDCCGKLGSGKTPRGGEKVYSTEGVLFLRSQNVHPDGLILEDAVFISPAIDEEMRSTRVQTSDVLLNITGASIGRCTIYNVEQPANVNQHVCILRAKREAVLPAFLAGFLQSEIGQKMIAMYSTKGNREGLNFAQLSAIPIHVPPIERQQKVCEQIRSLEDCRAIERTHFASCLGLRSKVLNFLLHSQ